jgi:hypothetical protein
MFSDLSYSIAYSTAKNWFIRWYRSIKYRRLLRKYLKLDAKIEFPVL